MPDISGLELLQHVRKNGELQNVPVISESSGKLCMVEKKAAHVIMLCATPHPIALHGSIVRHSRHREAGSELNELEI